MKHFATFLLAAAVVPTGWSQATAAPTVAEQKAIDPIALDLAHQIIDISSPPESRDADLAEQFGALRKQVKSLMASRFDMIDPEMQAVFDGHMDRMWEMMVEVSKRHTPALIDSMAVAYARLFTVDELKEILSFAQTPAGRKFLQSGKEVLKDPGVLAVQQDMFEDMMNQFPALESALVSDLEKMAKKKG